LLEFIFLNFVVLICLMWSLCLYYI